MSEEAKPNLDLDPRYWFGRVIKDRLDYMADDYQRIANNLRRVADDVDRIGDPQGHGNVTATGLLLEILGRIERGTPGLTSLVRAVAEYEDQDFGPPPAGQRPQETP